MRRQGIAITRENYFNLAYCGEPHVPDGEEIAEYTDALREFARECRAKKAGHNVLLWESDQAPENE